jgi:hypothetical protein
MACDHAHLGGISAFLHFVDHLVQIHALPHLSFLDQGERAEFADSAYDRRRFRRIGIAALERGINDYVLKTPQYLRRLPYTIRTVLKNVSLQDERDRTEKLVGEYIERLEVENKIDQVLDEELRQYAKRLENLQAVSVCNPHGFSPYTGQSNPRQPVDPPDG